jgi:hypothetical protein
MRRAVFLEYLIAKMKAVYSSEAWVTANQHGVTSFLMFR